MKNNLKNTIEFIGLSYKKELLKIAFVNGLILVSALVIYLLLKKN